MANSPTSGPGLAVPPPANWQLIDYFHRRQPAMQSLLGALVNCESPSTVATAQEPIQSILTAELRQRQFRVRWLSGQQSGGQILAIPQARRRHQPIQLLLGHSDTVWPLGTLVSMPLTVRQGKLYGPGSYDMKAGLVMLLFAVEALLAHDLPIAVAPVVLINSDEEIGSRESTPVIRRLAQVADRALVLEPSLGPRGQLKTARKGVGHFTVQVTGQAAHAGLDPGKGASAILELTHVIQQLFALNHPARGITVNVGTIDGGLRANMVAPTSRAEVDVRVLYPEDGPRITAAIQGLRPTIPGTHLAIQGGMGRPPLTKTPGNRQLWQVAQAIAGDLQMPLAEATAGGGSDGNTTSLYTPTLDGLGAIGDGAHAPREHIFLDSLIERGVFLTRLLLAPPLQPLTPPAR